MDHDSYPPGYTVTVLASVKTIALIGASANPARASHSVMKTLLSKGYQVFPVNPGLAGQKLHGQKVYSSLAELPHPVDMVDIFRNSADAAAVVDDVLSLGVLPKVIWMQLGVRNDEAAVKAEAKGLTVIMNRCPAIELH